MDRFVNYGAVFCSQNRPERMFSRIGGSSYFTSVVDSPFVINAHFHSTQFQLIKQTFCFLRFQAQLKPWWHYQGKVTWDLDVKISKRNFSKNSYLKPFLYLRIRRTMRSAWCFLLDVWLLKLFQLSSTPQVVKYSKMVFQINFFAWEQTGLPSLLAFLNIYCISSYGFFVHWMLKMLYLI